MKANRPDIVDKDRQEKRCMLNDMTMPPKSVREKLSNYKGLAIEINRTSAMKTKITNVIIKA